MEAYQFDVFARGVGRATARRRVLVGLALSPFAGLVSRPATEAVAKKRHKKKGKKEKKPKPNEFGCFAVGAACKSAEACCSGICEGKKCRAHDTGTCEQSALNFCTADNPLGQKCNNSGNCGCLPTTAGSTFCANFNALSCAECERDADCAEQGFPPGSACAPVSQGNCAGLCESGMMCLIPCGSELPDPSK